MSIKCVMKECSVWLARGFSLALFLAGQSVVTEQLSASNLGDQSGQDRISQALVVAEKRTEPSGDAQKGKRVFEKYCINCHGIKGKGDGPIGRSLVPPAADLTILGGKPDTEIINIIRNGRPGTAMPAWKNDLPSQDITDILAHIRTLGT